MKDKIIKTLKQVFLTHLGRILFLAAPMFIIGGMMSPNGIIGENFNYKRNVTVFDWMVYISIGILLIEFGIMMFWAVKNTIGDIKEWLRNRK